MQKSNDQALAAVILVAHGSCWSKQGLCPDCSGVRARSMLWGPRGHKFRTGHFVECRTVYGT